ncbi:MAG: response regulator, partial [Gemmatimonadaceae bacterium]
QQEELRTSNQELETQARSLKASEELLKEQQEELQQVNEELEEKASLLSEQNKKVEQKNREVEAARVSLEDKAEQLALSSKYKSEFLANMSHELRTPLNSLLILAKLLSENKEGNLSEKQAEFARTILASGTDLLNLINDVLDLSKVEAGKMEIMPVAIPLAEVEDFARRSFAPVAEQKGLAFNFNVKPDTPPMIFTDGQRLRQILKNLMSNAIKFTESGSVTVTVSSIQGGRQFANTALDSASSVIAIEVRDTGIGIASDKQKLIFEAFQQADGTTSRKYGGTGLGLSISREIARLLGGEIRVTSKPGEGSAFTLLLPARYEPPEGRKQAKGGPPPAAKGLPSPSDPPGRRSPRRVTPAYIPAQSPGNRPGAMQDGSSPTAATITPQPREAIDPADVADDRHAIDPSDRVVLLIENDEKFASVLLEMAHQQDFKALIALSGEIGVELAHQYKPDAITLDIDLPGTDGWAVLNQLKHNADTRHIPVHIISGMHDRQHGLKAGALAYLEKPVSKEALEEAFGRISQFIEQRVKHLLIVEDDETQRQSIIELVGHDDVDITAVGNAQDALEAIRETRFDCMVLDLGLGGSDGTDGFELLEQVKGDPAAQELPIIIYTGRDLTPAEDTRLRKYAETIIVKDAKSPERLLDETALFLHRVEAKLPEQKRRMLEQLHNADAVFEEKNVLIVDDDVRNIFSLTSVLEEYGMKVSFAENGEDAVKLLESTLGIDLVLMDVMMPGMDGYDTTRAIRRMTDYRSVPIIALTAKAMKGDREKCIAAGASDYITKPVDTEQLISLMRVWLYQ